MGHLVGMAHAEGPTGEVSLFSSSIATATIAAVAVVVIAAVDERRFECRGRGHGLRDSVPVAVGAIAAVVAAAAAAAAGGLGERPFLKLAFPTYAFVKKIQSSQGGI